jgi:hypothetical protein
MSGDRNAAAIAFRHLLGCQIFSLIHQTLRLPVAGSIDGDVRFSSS